MSPKKIQTNLKLMKLISYECFMQLKMRLKIKQENSYYIHALVVLVESKAAERVSSLLNLRIKRK